MKRASTGSWISKFCRFAQIWLAPADHAIVGNRIKVTCTSCGDQEVSSLRVQARFCVETHEAEYEFVCPDCADAIVKPCDDRVLDALESIGVAIDFWSVTPKGPIDDGVVLTADDVDTFCKLLEDDTRFEQAVSELAA